MLLFTPRFFAATLPTPERTEVLLTGVKEVRFGEIVTGVVASVGVGGETPLAAQTVVVSGGGTAGRFLRDHATPGTKLSVRYDIAPSLGDKVRQVVAGGPPPCGSRKNRAYRHIGRFGRLLQYSAASAHGGRGHGGRCYSAGFCGRTPTAPQPGRDAFRNGDPAFEVRRGTRGQFRRGRFHNVRGARGHRKCTERRKRTPGSKRNRAGRPQKDGL